MQVKKFEFNYFSENTYLVYDETKEAVIIDCGAFFKQEKDVLKTFIEKNNLTVKHLLNTHLHLDHAFGNAFIYETFGVKPEYHKEEETILPGVKEQARAFGLNLDHEDDIPAIYLNEGDAIRFGNVILEVILVPGHSPGSLCFYSKENKSIFSGDVLFLESIGRSDLWGGNQIQLIEGIKTKLLTLPGDTEVYSGHGSPTTIEYERKHNHFLI